MTVDTHPWCIGIGRAPHVVSGPLKPKYRADEAVVCSDCLEQAVHFRATVAPRSVAAVVEEDVAELMIHRVHVVARHYERSCAFCRNERVA